MYQLDVCPICSKSDFDKYLTALDYTVSKEQFTIEICKHCSLLFTNPRPENSDLGKYYESKDYTSHTTDNRGIIDRIYRIARKFTLQWKYQTITESKTKNTLKILDYGCGTGDFLNYCKEKGNIVEGIEPNEKARKIAQGKNIPVHEQLPNSPQKFDVITLWHVLEHIPDLNQTLLQLHQRLDENGIMFIAVPNYQSNDAKVYQEKWAAYDVPRHLWHFSKNTMKALIEKNGFQLENIIPMKLDSYYVSLLSEKYRQGKVSPVSFVSAMYQGLTSNLKAKENTNYSSLIYKLRKNGSA